MAWTLAQNPTYGPYWKSGDNGGDDLYSDKPEPGFIALSDLAQANPQLYKIASGQGAHYTDNGNGFWRDMLTQGIPMTVGATMGIGAGLGALGVGAAATAPEVGALYSGLTPEALGAGTAGGTAAAATSPTLLADAGGVTDVPVQWDAAPPPAPAPAPSPMAGGAYDLGGGLYVDEFGNTTGGLFAGGPGTAGAGDFAASAPWYQPAVNLASKVPLGNLTNGLTLKYFLDKLGKAAPAAAGAYGASQMADAYKEMGQKYLDIGAPSRARYEESFAPGFSMASDPGYADALAQTTKETLHQLSPGSGNPAMQPNAWEQTLKDVNSKFAYPALQEYRRQAAGAGGLATLTAAAPAADANAIRATGSIYDALGAGAADIFNPPKSLSDILREMKAAGY